MKTVPIIDLANPPSGAIPATLEQLYALGVTPAEIAARWTDYSYDQGGAYWGQTQGTRIYCGHNLAGVRIYARASNPAEAAGLILEKCPDGSTCGGRTMVNGFPALVTVRQSQHAACVAMHASLSR